jgi:hypothetical protein
MLAATGCASSGDDTTEGGGNAFSSPTSTTPAATGPTLKDQITACKAVEAKAADATTTLDMVQSQINVQTCYSKALASHTAEIDAIKKKAGGMQITPAGATAAAYFDDYRNNHGTGAPAPTAWCTIGHAASSAFGGTLQRVEDASCAAGIEVHMAQIVSSEAELPGGGTPLAGPDGTADDLHALIPQIVAKMIANTPGDQDATTAEVTKTFDGAIAASNELCGLLEDAGKFAGGSAARDLLKACSAKAIGMLVADAKAMAQSFDR